MSRTRFVNLRDAEDAMPELRQMLEEAKARRFDVLILYDYNRLRDLLDPVAKTLAGYGAQVYSVNQPVEPLAPEDFNPFASDSESMMRGMSQIISRWQIADLRRKWRYGVTARVRKGLHPNRIPYGYMRQPEQEVAVPLPSSALVVIEIRDLFLAGISTHEIARRLTERGVPAPRGGKNWYASSIEMILRNPFYAGKVTFSRRKTIRDVRTDTTRTIDNPDAIIADGRHSALYPVTDYDAILAELERRRLVPALARYPWSGLLVCSVCGTRLERNGGIWRCKYPGTDHIGLKPVEANWLIPRALQAALRDAGPAPRKKTPAVLSRDTEADLEGQRRRIQAGYEKGVYTLEQAEEKIRVLDGQIAKLRDAEVRQLRAKARQEQFTSSLQEARAMLERLPEWALRDDPRIVNRLLLRLCDRVEVTPKREMRVYFRA